MEEKKLGIIVQSGAANRIYCIIEYSKCKWGKTYALRISR